MNDKEIIDAVMAINTEMHDNSGNEYMYLTYTTNGWASAVMFGDYQIWSDDEDMREYNEETDEYEEIEKCLRRQLTEEIEKIKKLLPENTEDEDATRSSI